MVSAEGVFNIDALVDDIFGPYRFSSLQMI